MSNESKITRLRADRSYSDIGRQATIRIRDMPLYRETNEQQFNVRFIERHECKRDKLLQFAQFCTFEKTDLEIETLF